MMKILLTMVIFISSQVFANGIPELTKPIQDEENVMSSLTLERLESEIRKLNDDNLAQVGVLIVGSLSGESIEEYSIKVAEKWKLGTKEEDNGIILIIAIKDKKIRIEVGQGLEHIITDLYSSRIIDEMKPFLRSQDYDQAISLAFYKIEEKIRENTPKKIKEREEREKLELIENEKRKEENQKIINLLLNIFGFLGAIWLIIWSFSNKEKNRLEESLLKLSDQKMLLDEELRKLRVDCGELTIDYEKEKIYLKIEEIEQLNSKKKELASKINNMKSYLGDS